MIVVQTFIYGHWHEPYLRFVDGDDNSLFVLRMVENWLILKKRTFGSFIKELTNYRQKAVETK